MFLVKPRPSDARHQIVRESVLTGEENELVNEYMVLIETYLKIKRSIQDLFDILGLSDTYEPSTVNFYRSDIIFDKFV